MNWEKGSQYDYPEGYPKYVQTIFEDLQEERQFCRDGFGCEKWEKIKKNIPKECHRYNWMVGVASFTGKNGLIDIRFTDGEYIPIRTIKWILKNDQILKGIRRSN